MARKSLTFTNMFRSASRRKHSNQNIEAQNILNEIIHDKKEDSIKRAYHGRKQKQNYYHGGSRAHANSSNSAMYFPPRKGKLKGYMRNNKAA